MSETVHSEVSKPTMSEPVGDSQIQMAQATQTQHNQQQQQHHQMQSQPEEVSKEKKSMTGNSSSSAANVNVNGVVQNARVTSRAGSQFLPGLHNATLPSKMAIIVGLCQIAVGGAMVLTGILAIRYQSYLFHYGTGMWAGLLSAITGMLGAMCTKKGVPTPNWLCGGRKWQIHVFLMAILFSLSSVVLLAIFSVSGLLQDAKTIMAVEMEDQSQLEELLENKNTSGIIINTVLLLLSILQVLLCFSSLGIAVRVLFKSRRSLLSSKGSTGSEVAIQDVGAEYRARKDHLIHWLGHQKPPNFIPLGFGSHHPSQKGFTNSHKSSSNSKSVTSYHHPSLIAIQPVVYPPPPTSRRMIATNLANYARQQQHMNLIHQSPPILLPHLTPQYAFAPTPTPMIPMSMCAVHGATPTPSIIFSHQHKGHNRRTGTPVSSVVSLAGPEHHQRRNQQRRRSHASNKSVGTVSSVKSFQTHKTHSSGAMPSHRSSKAPSVISVKTESEKNNEVEITEVDVSRTYTGLDRSVAEDFISTMSLKRRKQEHTQESSIDEDEEEDNTSSSDRECIQRL